MAKICPNCQYSNPDDKKVCSKCNFILEESIINDQNAFTDEENKSEKNNSTLINVSNDNGYNKQNSTIPEIVNKFNWGAFMFPIIWSIDNWIFPPLLYPIAYLLIVILRIKGLISEINYAYLRLMLNFIYIVIKFVLGINGNKIAFKSKRFKSIEHFVKIENIYNKIGIIFFIISIILIVIAILYPIIFGMSNN
ncbi:MAG: hypothetical protein IJS60_07015 [Abditibacteriota bacterium]|nr:hypothetical protein [Abditibacteriota bacterium]